MKTTLLIAGLIAAMALAESIATGEETCEGDTSCFDLCEKQRGRECTEDEVFGPPQEYADDVVDFADPSQQLGKRIPNFDADGFRADALGLVRP